MISTKLRTTAVIIIFLLLLILDIPEFIICMSLVPDEILDVPCVLVTRDESGNDNSADKLLKTIVEMLESDYCPPQKMKPTGFHALIDSCYAAEIKRHYLCSRDIRHCEETEEIYLIYLMREINRPIIPMERSNHMLSIFRTPIPSILRI